MSQKQTKLMSFVEAWGNVAIGFGINFAANMIILPMFGFHSLTAEKAIGIGILFTFVSVGRSYILRRGFEILRVKGIGQK